MPRFPSARARRLAVALGLGALALFGTALGQAPGQAGLQWTSRMSAANNDWYSVTYGGGQFVAVGVGSSDQVMTSPDGVSWTSRAASDNNSWLSVAYGNGVYVAAAWAGNANRVMTSPDGIAWTSRAVGDERRWRSVTFAEGRFVAVAEGVQGSMAGSPLRAMTSTDGINWTESIAPGGWSSVVHGEGLFVAVGGSGVMRSTNGVDWTIGSLPASVNQGAVTYGAGRFVAVGSNGGVVTSEDGVTWVQRTAPPGSWFGLSYGAGQFVAVSWTSTYVMTSPDGLVWTAGVPAANNMWHAVTYANGVFVAVAVSGTGDRVMTSGAFLSPPDPPAKPTATAGDSQATVGVTPGVGSGGAPSSYEVTASPGGRTCAIAVPATSCTITGLANGTAYTFTATATNSTATSGPSMASDPVTPTAPPAPPAPSAPSAPSSPSSPPSLPSRPTGVTVYPGNGSARVVFDGPAAGQGAVRYTVTARPRLMAIARSIGPALRFPNGLAVDAAGTGFSTNDQPDSSIRMTAADGRIGRLAASAPFAVVTDPRGNVYWTVPRAGALIRATPDGEKTILARTSGELRPLAIDGSGNLYTGDSQTGEILTIAPGGQPRALARTGDEPTDIAVDPAGRVHVLLRMRGGSSNVRKLLRIDVNGTSSLSWLPGRAENLAVDARGNTYIGNSSGTPVTRVSPDGVVSAFGPERLVNSGVATSGIAVAGDGTVYVARYDSGRGVGEGIDAITPDGSMQRFVAPDDVIRLLLLSPSGDLYWIKRNMGSLMRALPLERRTCSVTASAAPRASVSCNLTGLVNGAEYLVTVQGEHDLGVGPPSDAALAVPRASLRAFVADPPAASDGAITLLSTQMGLAGSTVSANATPAGVAASAASRHPMLHVAHATAPLRVRGTCTTKGLTATCRLRLPRGRWRVTLTERNNGAVVGQVSTVLRTAGPRTVAVTG